MAPISSFLEVSPTRESSLALHIEWLSKDSWWSTNKLGSFVGDAASVV